MGWFAQIRANMKEEPLCTTDYSYDLWGERRHNILCHIMVNRDQCTANKLTFMPVLGYVHHFYLFVGYELIVLKLVIGFLYFFCRSQLIKESHRNYIEQQLFLWREKN